MRSFALPALCQVLPRWFPPCFDTSHPGPAAPSLAGKHIADSCSLSTKMMVHLAWDAGPIPCCGRWEPPRFCQERRRRAFGHPRLALLAAFSRPYPGVIRCRTVFHCYTCTVPKGPEGHSGPSASFPGSIGYVGAACSHVPLSADAWHAAPAGLLHRTRRNHAQCDGAVPPAQPAGAR